jgi:hypothetical protein
MYRCPTNPLVRVCAVCKDAEPLVVQPVPESESPSRLVGSDDEDDLEDQDDGPTSFTC